MTTTYRATAVRSDGWWEIEITSGLPDNMLGVSQCRRLGEVEYVVRDVVADLLDIDSDDVEVVVTVELSDDLKQAVEFALDASAAEDAARTQAATARSSAALAMLDAGLTTREAGQVLGISHQRVQQLADRARARDDADIKLEPGVPDDRITSILMIALEAAVAEAKEARQQGSLNGADEIQVQTDSLAS